MTRWSAKVARSTTRASNAWAARDRRGARTAWRCDGSHRGAVHATHPGAGRRFARHSEGRRRVSANRSRLSGRTDYRDAGPFKCARHRHRLGVRRALRGPFGSAPWCSPTRSKPQTMPRNRNARTQATGATQATKRNQRSATNASASKTPSTTTRLHDLHLRIDAANQSRSAFRMARSPRICAHSSTPIRSNPPTVSCSSPPSASTSPRKLLAPLVAGATVVMRGDALWDMATLNTVFERERVTGAHLPTAYWLQWLNHLPTQAFPTLRWISVGGEPLPGDGLRRWHASASPACARQSIRSDGSGDFIALSHHSRNRR